MSESSPEINLRAALVAHFEDFAAFGVDSLARKALASEPAEPELRPELKALLLKSEPRSTAKAFAESQTPTRLGAPASADSLETLAAEVRNCTQCGLHATRRQAVPGQGSPNPRILFVGEAPGEDEDRQGLAFVGLAGQLLTKMIQAMGFRRDEVFIANVLKCRPPGNREPAVDEVARCTPYLWRQVELLKPEMIITLGAHAARNVLGTENSVGRLRGRVHRARNTKVVVTYHPSYLLRDPREKPKAWEDLKLALRELGLEPPKVEKSSASAPDSTPPG